MSGKQPEDKSDQEKDEEKALEEVPEEMRGTIAEICKKLYHFLCFVPLYL